MGAAEAREGVGCPPGRDQRNHLGHRGLASRGTDYKSSFMNEKEASVTSYDVIYTHNHRVP